MPSWLDSFTGGTPNPVEANPPVLGGPGAFSNPVASQSVLQIDPMGGGSGGPGVSVYTASKVPFEQFDPKFIGSGVGHNYNGYGFYLTGNKGYATAVRDQYHPGGVVHEAEIKAGKLFNLDAKRVGPDVADRIGWFTGQPLGKLATGRDALYELENVPVGAYRQLFGDPTISTSQQGASRFLSQLGYQGNKYTDRYGEHYVIFDPKDLEVVNASSR